MDGFIGTCCFVLRVKDGYFIIIIYLSFHNGDNNRNSKAR